MKGGDLLSRSESVVFNFSRFHFICFILLVFFILLIILEAFKEDVFFFFFFMRCVGFAFVGCVLQCITYFPIKSNKKGGK